KAATRSARRPARDTPRASQMARRRLASGSRLTNLLPPGVPREPGRAFRASLVRHYTVSKCNNRQCQLAWLDGVVDRLACRRQPSCTELISTYTRRASRAGAHAVCTKGGLFRSIRPIDAQSFQRALTRLPF